MIGEFSYENISDIAKLAGVSKVLFQGFKTMDPLVIKQKKS